MSFSAFPYEVYNHLLAWSKFVHMLVLGLAIVVYGWTNCLQW